MYSHSFIVYSAVLRINKTLFVYELHPLKYGIMKKSALPVHIVSCQRG